MQLLLDTSLLAVEPRGDVKMLRYRNGAGETADVTIDAILVATGRLPYVEELGLKAVGVAFDPHTGI